MYYVNPDNISILYGDVAAQHPEPKFLYKQEPAQGEYMGSTKKWIPNCYLFDPKFYRSGTGVFLTQTGKAVKEDVQGGIDTVKGNLDRRKVKLGIIALNDCARFAVALMRIMKDNGIIGGFTNPDNLTCAMARILAAPQLADTFLLDYGGAYHGITVVAKARIGDSFVTLEAHASKMRKNPDFHIYTGMVDFVARNFTVALQATGRIRLIPHDAGVGIIPAQGLAIQEMKDACGHLEKMVRKKKASQIFTLLQAPENPRVTTYLPALYQI